MKKIERPSLVGKEREIFIECANDFTKRTDYTEVALSYIDEVEKCSKEYEKYVPSNISNLPHSIIKEDDKKVLNKIYEQKFVPKESIGRKYYNEIIKNAKKRCPICGGGTPKNLDHFLPKSIYPLLSVSPINLVPVCRDCNMEKGDSFNVDYYEIPFHPYLEDMPDKWIECRLEFFKDRSFSLQFINGFIYTNNPNYWRKYNAHMNITGIDDSFASKAEEEMGNIKEYYKNEVIECGKDHIQKNIRKIRESAETDDINSWKAALYRALERECDKFCDWLMI